MNSEQVSNTVAAARQRRGLSVAALASAIGVSRQSLYDIESGAYVPNTLLALRLARTLDTPLDQLFALPPVAKPAMEQIAIAVDGRADFAANEPVQLCYVEEKLVAVPAIPGPFWLSDADAVVTQSLPRPRRLRVRCHHPEPVTLRNRLLISGCDPAMSVLLPFADDAGVDLLFAHQNSAASLQALKAGRVHIAGTHLRRRSASEPTLANIVHTFKRDSVAVVSFALWQEGLVVASGNPKHIASPADLARRDVRFVNRELGSGCRALLDAHLAQHGIQPAQVAGYENTAAGHLSAAAQVKSKTVDCCIANGSAARAFGLGFVPIEDVQYDLVLRQADLAMPPAQKLLNVLCNARFRRQLAACSGYDTSATGKRLL